MKSDREAEEMPLPRAERMRTKKKNKIQKKKIKPGEAEWNELWNMLSLNPTPFR